VEKYEGNSKNTYGLKFFACIEI